MAEQKKIKIVTIGDHPLVSSGVGGQSKYIIEGLLKTGRYQVRSLAGLMRHEDYRPIKTQEYGEDWIIYPVNGYGDEKLMRELMDHEKPDAIWFMTDPRFYIWLFNMSDEIRDRGIPLLYYHVWDNYPVPTFNKPYYESCDFVGCISKLTYDILCKLNLKDRAEYLPHAADPSLFKPLPKEEIMKMREEIFGKANAEKFVVFYNSRNARRKMTSDVVKIFKMFLDEVGDKGILFMQTDPHDHEGANLLEVAKMLDMKPHQIMFSPQRLPTEQIAKFYAMADITMNISNNEGFGLSCLESLYCGTPVIVNKTGGLQDQPISDTGRVFGVMVEPATRSLTGSQDIPFILDDRCSDQDLVTALKLMYNMTFDQRKSLGAEAREWVLRSFSLENLITKWDHHITRLVTQYKEKGNPDRIKFKKVA